MQLPAFLRSLCLIAMLATGLSLAACTKAPEGRTEKLEADDNNDPLEPMNRGFYQFNRAVDVAILRPISWAYAHGVPDKGRQMISNALDNLYTPVQFANSVLQGDPQNSFVNLWRFLINSSFGVAGLFDPATDVGLKARPTDFGQTLALYGAEPGPYLVLPFFGPSGIRDGIGRGVDTLMNPITYTNTPVSLSVAGATAIDWRSENMDLVDNIYRDSLDPYATFRSAFTQKRVSEIKRARTARQKVWDENFTSSKSSK